MGLFIMWLAGAVVGSLILIRVFAHEFSEGEPDTSDFVCGSLVGFLAWPIVISVGAFTLLVYGAYSYLQRLNQSR